jgi:rhamnogalacturonyl hydrolase YesR
MIDYRKYTGDHSFDTNIEKGMKYYLSTFFDKEGRSAYYSNSLYPIDIHAPSQLFVTLHKAGNFAENRQLADRVLEWTVKNMQSEQGYFYYQKRKYLTNKIPYMRWSQAWIFYGLTYYLLNEDKEAFRKREPSMLSREL